MAIDPKGECKTIVITLVNYNYTCGVIYVAYNGIYKPHIVIVIMDNNGYVTIYVISIITITIVTYD